MVYSNLFFISIGNAALGRAILFRATDCESLRRRKALNKFMLKSISIAAIMLCGTRVMAARLLPGIPLGTFPNAITISEPPDEPLPSSITGVIEIGLPGPVVPGDVVLLEPDWTGPQNDPSGWSNVFAFADPAVSNSGVRIYSDPSDDVTPLNLGRALTNPVYLTEPPTLPKIVTYQVPGVTYTLISDVPEPSSFVLVCMGILSLIAYAWRRRK
jgi:hypothetical protein